MINTRIRNRKKHVYIILVFLILALSTIFFIMYKYHVEGEQNLPFNITKFIIASSAETENLELNDGLYQANILQKNDIYIAIEKNEKYSKEDAIKKISFENFNIIQSPKVGNINIYRTAKAGRKFDYKEENKTDKLEYKGSKETNLLEDEMTISNQGGLLEFSIALNDLGKITYQENEDIIADGTLIKRLNLNSEDIKTKISFDMLMELTSGNIFKTTIILELPVKDIVNEGVATQDNMDLSKLVFKRVF